MTAAIASATPRTGGVAGAFQRAIALLESVPYSALALLARISVAAVFWQSGQTKVQGLNVFQLSDSAVFLFQEEYRLPLVDPALAAHAAAIAEHLFPLLLIVGLASRFSAIALLTMTLVIQVFVYPDAWPTHGTWAACLLLIITRGPGVVSLDHIVARAAR